MDRLNSSLVTVDLGNSGGSAALVSRVSDPRRGSAAEWQVELLARWNASEEGHDAAAWVEEARLRGGALAAVSAVGAHVREERMAALLGATFERVLVRPDAGLEMRIDHPETCGSDRQYAARGALGARSGAGARVIVIDVGTALTVDAAVLEEAGPGAFLGGSISLGPEGHARALSAAGARLPEFDLEGTIAALGRSSVEALRSGVAVGLAGATLELAARIGGEAFGALPGVEVHLTGGARRFVEPRLREEFGEALLVDPLLVHRGLALAAWELP